MEKSLDTEIELKSFFYQINNYKWLIIVITLFFILIGLGYIILKNDQNKDYYKSSVLLEIGQILSKSDKNSYIESPYDIRAIVSHGFEYEGIKKDVTAVKGTHKFVLITLKGEEKQMLINALKDIVSAILSKHQIITERYESSITITKVDEALSILNKTLSKEEKNNLLKAIISTKTEEGFQNFIMTRQVGEIKTIKLEQYPNAILSLIAFALVGVACSLIVLFFMLITKEKR